MVELEALLAIEDAQSNVPAPAPAAASSFSGCGNAGSSSSSTADFFEQMGGMGCATMCDLAARTSKSNDAVGGVGWGGARQKGSSWVLLSDRRLRGL